MSTYDQPRVTEQTPRRMWGNVTVAGTRIPVFRIRELMDEGYTVEQIVRDLYPGRITAEQVREVVQ